MKFSVLIPIYNVKDYLPAMLESLDAQTFRDFEAVLVDDGSNDGSELICDEYCSSHPFASTVL